MKVNGVILPPDLASVTIIRCDFGRKKMGCLKGFGICRCKPFPKDYLSSDGWESDLERRISRRHKSYFAALILDDDRSKLEVRFLESMPHFDRDFFVDEGYEGAERMLRNVCGYREILPTIGTYRAEIRRGAPHGLVHLDVLRGRRLARG